MKFRILISILIVNFLFINFNLAQDRINTTIIKGKVEDLVGGEGFMRILGSDAHYFYAMGQISSSYYVQKYDRQMDMIAEWQFESEYISSEGNTTYQEAMIYTNDNVYSIESVLGRGGKRVGVYAILIDKVTMKTSSSNLICNFNYKGEENDIQIISSPDKSKLMFIYKVSGSTKGSQYEICVTDNQFEKLWSKEFMMKDNDDIEVDLLWYLTNEGNLFWIEKYSSYVSQFDQRTTYRIYTYSFSYLKNNGTEQLNLPFKSSENPYGTLRIVPLKNDEVVVTGVVIDSISNESLGLFYQRINITSKENIVSTVYKFTLDFLFENLSQVNKDQILENKAKGQPLEAAYFGIREVLGNDSLNDLLIIAEDYYGGTNYVESMLGSSTEPNYLVANSVGYEALAHYMVFNDNIYVSVNRNGEFGKIRKIHKCQNLNRNSIQYGSFIRFPFKGWNCILTNHVIDTSFNVTARSVILKEDATSQLSLYTFKSPEDIKVQKILNNSEQAVLFSPVISQMISDHELLIYGTWYNKQQFMIIRLD